MERRLATVLAVDVVGYSRLMRKNEERTLVGLLEVRRLVDQLAGEHGGRAFGAAGDSILAEFTSPVEAVRCSIKIQKTSTETNEGLLQEDRMPLRIGVNIGDVMDEGGALYGDGVNVAARLESLAEPGGICVSGAVYDHVRDRIDLNFADAGEQVVKNIDRPVQAWKWPPTGVRQRPNLWQHKTFRRAFVAGIVIVGLAVAAFQFRPNPATTPVIAVLPFEDFSPPPHQGYLNDAVSSSIITSLARYPQLSVISQRSSFQFRNSDLGISEIAERLGADFILEGSQQYDGTRLRTTAQLIDGTTEAHIWADEFDVPLKALLKTNSQISRKIANAVGARVVDTAEAQMTEGDVSALLIANAAQSRIVRNFNRDNLLINIKEQEQSLNDYPESAWGHLGQALSLRIGLRFGWIDGDEEAIRKRMYDLARRGVELDPNNFMAYHALGRALMFNRDVEAAAVAFRRAVELNPSAFFSRNALAQALSFVGETDEALTVIAESERIDPLYGHDIHWEKAKILWQMGKCDQALDTFQSAPSMPVAANKTLAAIYICLGKQKEATRAMADFVAENSNWTVSRERDVITGMWTAPGALDQWLTALEKAGMPL